MSIMSRLQAASSKLPVSSPLTEALQASVGPSGDAISTDGWLDSHDAAGLTVVALADAVEKAVREGIKKRELTIFSPSVAAAISAAAENHLNAHPRFALGSELSRGRTTGHVAAAAVSPGNIEAHTVKSVL